VHWHTRVPQRDSPRDRTVNRSRFRHSAFAFHSDDQYIGRVVEFLLTGLEAGEGAVVASTRDRQALLRGALGSTQQKIAFLDIATVSDHPAQAVATQYAAMWEQLQRFPAVRMLVELDGEPPGDEGSEWVWYELALAKALAELPVFALYAYDARRASGPLLEAALRIHPELLGGDPPAGAHGNPIEALRELTPAPQPLPDLRTVACGDEPEALREHLAAGLAEMGIEAPSALKALIAANELIVNACRHGLPPVELRLGLHGGRVVCEVVDSGNGFEDPLAGFDPPGEPGGAAPGLWVVRQQAWRFETFHSRDGFTVRLWL
jgi:anti-sigma regulatory factor (Ser/Thr protein kinase)